MPWHPPIPAGKLYSGPALSLGPALAMLIWCYDGIQRDGTIEIQLENIQQELNVSYRTIKDWWKLLKSGPFFCEQFDRGKRGWVVRMAEDWIDWHVMTNNYGEGRNSALEDRDADVSMPDEGQISALEDVQGPVKARSRPSEGRNSALETSAYKVLMTPDQAESHERVSEDRDGTARTHAHKGLALATVAEFFPDMPLDAKLARKISSTATDGTVWRSVVEMFSDNGWQPLPGNLLDRYRKEAAKAQQHANGQRPAEVRPPLPVVTYKPPADALSPAEIAQRLKEHRR